MSEIEHGAPELERFFKNMNRSATHNYCVICLRTEEERTLVTSRYLKKFTTAVKIDNRWQNYQTCYICERQASNAFKFFKAAAFASSVNKMFKDLVLFKRRGCFNDNFINALKKLSKGTNLAHPCDWEAQLKLIRKRTQMNETEPLIIDNQGVKSKPILDPDEVFVIPDDSTGQVTATATRSCGVTDFPDGPDSGRGGRRRTQPDRHRSKHERTSSVIVSTENSFILSSTEPKVSETLVIIDEDEQDPLHIEKVEWNSIDDQRPLTPDLPTLQPKPKHLIEVRGSQSAVNIVPNHSISRPQSAVNIIPNSSIIEPQSVLNIVPNHSISRPQTPVNVILNSSIIGPQSVLNKMPDPTTGGPQSVLNMVPIERLLEKPKTPDNLIPNNCVDTNFTIHPIILTGGVLTVPTLSATIIDGVLTVQNTAEPNSMLKELLIQNPPKEIIAPTIDPICQTNIPDRCPNSNKILNSEAHLAKNKRDHEFMFATPSKKVKGLPVIESVAAEADRSDRIDWEDKIPMDVISFVRKKRKKKEYVVDAVDPNPQNLMDTNIPPNLGQMGGMSQVHCTPTPVDPNVIDLC